MSRDSAGWSNFSLHYSLSQSSTALTPIASVTGTVAGQFYQLLSNTFMVPTSGIYYLAVKAIGNSNAYYLSFDDLFVTVPCTPVSLNSPTIALTTNSTTICENDVINLSASGADTYTWSTGSNAASITDTPTSYTVYSVTGTNTLSGCAETRTQAILVNLKPSVSIFATSTLVCVGQITHLTGAGANSYAWSTSAAGNIIAVAPTANTTYTVTGVNGFGCTAMASQLIMVNTLPVITASSNLSSSYCYGEPLVLSANGAQTYQWISDTSPLVYQGSFIAVSPSVTTIYTVTGTDMNGCVNKTTLAQNVTICSGISALPALQALTVYPNPTSGEISLETYANVEKHIDVIDLTGRIMISLADTAEKVNVNLSGLNNGVYYLKIRSNESVNVIKIIKQ